MIPTYMESNTKRCQKCAKPLLVNGIHMGLPFAIRHNPQSVSPMSDHTTILVCSKCYDEITVEELKKDA